MRLPSLYGPDRSASRPSPGFIAEAGRYWAMVHSKQLQATAEKSPPRVRESIDHLENV